jgi:hypothetical protein
MGGRICLFVLAVRVESGVCTVYSRNFADFSTNKVRLTAWVELR